MTSKIYQVDAFCKELFSGNPAAVCPLESWPGDDILQKIAAENNLAETAFYINKGSHYEIRWFTPSVEVDLCGHATLASAFVIFNFESPTSEELIFISPRSGELKVSRQGEKLQLDFPRDQFHKVPLTPELNAGFDIPATEAWMGKTDLMLVFEREEQIRNIKFDLAQIAKLSDARGVIITAPGDEVDFVSRFFAPQSGIDEDPVTGSAHTTLTPYWSERLDKKSLTAMQLSPRMGYLNLEDRGSRVSISGVAKLYLKGEIYF